jgi:Trk K+ transport system NAD-binding subunit
VPLITGPARAEETLMSAGLAEAVAVICAQDNDLSALETALLARRLRAEVRVVAQLTNPAVGRAVKDAGVAVLDVAGLSAPSVVEVCLGEGVQEMSLSGMRFLAARTTAPSAATLRELYGALAPVAVVPPAGDVLVCPGRDTEVSAGDEVTLIGTPDELAAADIIDHPERIRRLTATAAPSPAPGSLGVLGVLGGDQPDDPRAGHGPADRAVRTLRDLAVSLARATDRRMAIALGALLAVLVTATLVLRFTYRYAGPGHRISLLDAAYFTVETVTTVGYGDYSFRGEPAWLVLFAVLLMMTGALFVAVFFALVTNMLVSRRIEESLGLQKITALRGHVLVIGLGTVGLRVARQLHDAGRDVVVIEKSERNRHLGQLRALGVPVMIADATLPEVLASARLAAASAVAVLTSDDLANLETGLAVRDQLGPRWPATPVVLRIGQAHVRVQERPVHRRARRPVVRRRGPRPRRALHVLRRRRAAAHRPAYGHARRRPRGPADGRADGAHPRTRAAPRRRPLRARAPAAPYDALPPGGRGVPHRPLRRAADGAPPRPALPRPDGRWPRGHRPLLRDRLSPWRWRRRSRRSARCRRPR